LRTLRAWRRTPVVLPKASREAGPADPPCLLYLMHRAYCPDSLREFAAAWRANPPGCACELTFLAKGFASPAQAKPYLDEVADLAPRIMFVPDRGFDLGSYLEAAARLRRHRYCFVKSQCRPLVYGWLAKLDAALDRSGAGQVGATGTWTSTHSWALHTTGLPSAYRELLPSRRAIRELMGEIQAEQDSGERPSIGRSVQMRLRTLPNVPKELFGFAPFPTPHLRPAACMITHAALTELRLCETSTKPDALALESGRGSITNQLERIGLSSLVVDRAGVAYEPGRWPFSRTFLQGDQEGLLVAENHTDCYAAGDLARRQLLSRCAWGALADPSPPREGSTGQRGLPRHERWGSPSPSRGL
jgi:hypothetical protein